MRATVVSRESIRRANEAGEAAPKPWRIISCLRP